MTKIMGWWSVAKRDASRSQRGVLLLLVRKMMLTLLMYIVFVASCSSEFGWPLEGLGGGGGWGGGGGAAAMSGAGLMVIVVEDCGNSDLPVINDQA